MPKFILDINKLEPGDIILERLHDHESDIISRFGHTQHTHAMLYVATSSVIEAMEDIVISNNPARELFDNPEDVRVLRLKPEYAVNISIDTIIEYVRQRVGNRYSKEEAKRIRHRPDSAIECDRQTCTRLVANAYKEAGILIVTNPDYCVPQEMLESEKLIIVREPLKEATDDDIIFAESNNTLNIQHDAYKQLLERSREILNEDFVQDESSLNEGVRMHPEKAHEVAEVVRESGYLNLIIIDKKLNPWNYDSKLFAEHYGDNSLAATMQLESDYNVSKNRFLHNVYAISSYIENCGNNEYFTLMRDHYLGLCIDCDVRLSVLKDVREELSDVFYELDECTDR